MTGPDIRAEALEALASRTTWENRQALYYQMRHDGIRRRNKPFPEAADMHYPLADTVIDKQKPFYWKQLFLSDKIATFLSMRKDQAKQRTAAAADWFDFKIKNESNFQEEILIAIDHMLQSSPGLLKIRWDTDAKRVEFCAIDPIYLIVPADTISLEKADWIIQVHQLSKAAYMRDPHYKQGAEVMARIVGNPETTQKEQDKYRREGITHSKKDGIVVWECWVKKKDGYEIQTFSPTAPDLPLRETMAHPYQHGESPFIEFHREIKDKGYYASRGITAKVAPFEVSLCRLWNDKLDAMTYYNRPLYTGEQDFAGNPGNMKFLPGQYVKGNIRAVTPGSPPISFDQEMINQRMVAEQHVGTPDFGIGQQLNTSERKTAREVDSIMQVHGQVIDLNSAVFMMAITRVLRQAWRLYCEFDQGLEYLHEGEVMTLEQEAKHLDYAIVPNGSAQLMNTSAQINRAVAVFDRSKGNPFVDQGELTKYLLETIDPKSVKRLWINPETLTGQEAEDEALEICALMEGFPMQVKETDNHLVRVQILLGKFQQLGATERPVDPIARMRLQQHLLQHMAALRQQNPEAFQQIMAEIGPQIQAMAQQAQNPQAMEEAA